MATVNETGTVQERYVYDAFGNINGLNSDWNRTFTGQVLDAETGLMLYRNRFYSTELGRFLQRDPIGYDAGDMNLVRYVNNQPQTFTDAHGLWAPLAIPAIAPDWRILCWSSRHICCRKTAGKILVLSRH